MAGAQAAAATLRRSREKVEAGWTALAAGLAPGSGAFDAGIVARQSADRAVRQRGAKGRSHRQCRVCRKAIWCRYASATQGAPARPAPTLVGAWPEGRCSVQHGIKAMFIHRGHSLSPPPLRVGRDQKAAVRSGLESEYAGSGIPAHPSPTASVARGAGLTQFRPASHAARPGGRVGEMVPSRARRQISPAESKTSPPPSQEQNPRLPTERDDKDASRACRPSPPAERAAKDVSRARRPSPRPSVPPKTPAERDDKDSSRPRRQDPGRA